MNFSSILSVLAATFIKSNCGRFVSMSQIGASGMPQVGVGIVGGGWHMINL